MIRFEDFEAYVRNVVDGDTITVERGRFVLSVRIAHIDAPESGQAFCVESRDLLKSLVGGQWVHVHPLCGDRYGRIVAEIRNEGCKDISAEMIRKGMAWWLQGKKRDEGYGEIEAEARDRKVGVHSIRNQEKPWNYRKNKNGFKTK